MDLTVTKLRIGDHTFQFTHKEGEDTVNVASSFINISFSFAQFAQFESAIRFLQNDHLNKQLEKLQASRS